jgi:hypothetical protein
METFVCAQFSSTVAITNYRRRPVLESPTAFLFTATDPGYSSQYIADSDTPTPPKAAPSTKSTTAKQDRGENKREGEDVKAKKIRRSGG